MVNQTRIGANLFKFPDRAGLSALEIIEQNRESFEANIQEVEAQYAGKFVRDKELNDRLLQCMQTEAAMRGGKVSRQIHLPDYPAEEFVAIPVVFDVKVPGGNVQSKRWYFVKRPRLFKGAH